MRFEQLARWEGYPPGRELVVREVCRALYAVGSADELCAGARQAVGLMRSLASRVDADRRARMLALDAACAADELVRMARVARADVGRG